MSCTVKFSDGSTAGDRFEAFELDPRDKETLERLSDSSEDVYALSFSGPGARAGHKKLKAVEAKRVLNGQPRANLAGTFEAVCQGQGELVKLELTLYNALEAGLSETVSLTGIVTGVEYRGGPGGHLVQSLDIVFYRCAKLHIVQGGALTTLVAA